MMDVKPNSFHYPRDLRLHIDRARNSVHFYGSRIEWIEYGYDLRDTLDFGWQATGADVTRQGFASMKDSDCTCYLTTGGHIVGTREYGGQFLFGPESYKANELVKPPMRCPGNDLA